MDKKLASKLMAVQYECRNNLRLKIDAIQRTLVGSPEEHKAWKIHFTKGEKKFAEKVTQ
jgi:hypothetical protein